MALKALFWISIFLFQLKDRLVPTKGSDRSARLTEFEYAFQSHQQVTDRTRDSDTHIHTIQDDLESVFYALCWSCYGYDHTGRPDKFRPGWMQEWTGRYASCARSQKFSFRSSEISSHVNRYMGCQRDIMESVIDQIRRRIARAPSDPEKDVTAILDILEKGIAETRKEQCGTTSECSKVLRSAVGAPTTKRNLCEVGRNDCQCCKKLKGPIAVTDEYIEYGRSWSGCT
ncbi:hypothetical protein B0H19DRAFT_1320808 [Mycena capillaripes]|nr:hypothetical protein B0H19DRAFT_1320808 [Mycena capillaripes]